MHAYVRQHSTTMPMNNTQKMELFDRIVTTWQEANRMSSKTMAQCSPCLKRNYEKIP